MIAPGQCKHRTYKNRQVLKKKKKRIGTCSTEYNVNIRNLGNVKIINNKYQDVKERKRGPVGALMFRPS